MAFNEKRTGDILVNPFESFSKDWVLITAKKGDKVNTMTAAWGGLGHVWNHDIVTIYIRPQRYTKEFVDGSDYFSICVLPESFRDKLVYLGRVSGKDEDKITKTGLTVEYTDGVPYFAEATLVYIAKKLYADDLEEKHFINHEIVEKVYPEKDFHTLYIGGITKILKKEERG